MMIRRAPPLWIEQMYTQAQLDALLDAIASGATRVVYDGRVIEYRSLADMRATAREIQLALNPDTKVTRQIQVVTFRGY